MASLALAQLDRNQDTGPSRTTSLSALREHRSDAASSPCRSTPAARCASRLCGQTNACDVHLGVLDTDEHCRSEKLPCLARLQRQRGMCTPRSVHGVCPICSGSGGPCLPLRITRSDTGSDREISIVVERRGSYSLMRPPSMRSMTAQPRSNFVFLLRKGATVSRGPRPGRSAGDATRPSSSF